MCYGRPVWPLPTPTDLCLTSEGVSDRTENKYYLRHYIGFAVPAESPGKTTTSRCSQNCTSQFSYLNHEAVQKLNSRSLLRVCVNVFSEGTFTPDPDLAATLRLSLNRSFSICCPSSHYISHILHNRDHLIKFFNQAKNTSTPCLTPMSSLVPTGPMASLLARYLGGSSRHRNSQLLSNCRKLDVRYGAVQKPKYVSAMMARGTAILMALSQLFSSYPQPPTLAHSSL
ncbi:hypothetical protein CLF_101904 [Clonorchis sinensis]|uniref:Uncharacterized protein n=1 Tax=Clonorchis sinensis TaxID=79923 RepID=G7Y6U5_CLOSI|nr:hypothetical protein CLF_101904 [Clonorchis sinensis]